MLSCDGINDIEAKKLCQGLSFACGVIGSLGMDRKACEDVEKGIVDLWQNYKCSIASDDDKRCLELPKKFKKKLKEMKVPDDMITKTLFAMRNWMLSYEKK